MNKLFKFLFGRRPDRVDLLPPVQPVSTLHFHGGALSTDPTDNLIDTPGMETKDWWLKADEVRHPHTVVVTTDGTQNQEAVQRIASILKSERSGVHNFYVTPKFAKAAYDRATEVLYQPQPERVMREHFERLRDNHPKADPIKGPKIGDKRKTPFVPLPSLYSDDDWGGLGVDPTLLAPQFRK